MTTTIFKRGLLPLLLAASVGAAVAAPTGQQVVAGQATFNQQGNVFSITNTPGTIINWQSFSIGAGEITRFIQQSADSAVLNRIVGQDPSRILGALQSNGKVFLINPNGIVFGRDARVDVNGLVASSLNLSNADFLAGKKYFQAGAVAGEVRNEGAITTPAGGQVYLIAPNVGNSGIIKSPQGEVVLAAGHSVQLVDSRDPDMNLVVSAPADQSINLGQVVAQGGRIGIYGALVSQRGIVNADSAVVGENGKIVLKASRSAQLEAGSVTSATGAGQGGTVHLLGDSVALNGDARVDASGAQGGGTVLVGGDWQGANAALANATTTSMSGAASIKADAQASGDGGKVVLWSTQSTAASGSISAHGAGGGKGGQVETSGHSLAVDGIRVDAGKGGKWLLDPYDIEVNASGTAVPGDVASANAGTGTGVTKIAPATLTAGGADIMLQAQHDITFTDALNASGNVTASAGNNINVNANVASSFGNLVLHASNGIYLASGASLKGNNYIDLIANQMTLGGTIGAAGGQLPVISFNPASDSRQIRIGSGTPVNGVLWLDAAALQRFSAFELNVGSSANTGGISVDGALNVPGSVVLDSAGPVSINAPLTVGTSGSVVATLHGAPGTLLSVNAAVSAGKLVQLKGDGLRIGAPVSAASVVLAPHSATTPIVLGKLDETAFALTEAMIKQVNAGSLTIGGQPGQVGGTQVAGPVDLTTHPFGKLVIDAGAPNLTVDSVLTMPSGALTLKTGGDMAINGSVATNSGSISLSSGGDMTVAGSVTSGSGSITMGAGSKLTVVPGARVSSTSGDINVTAGSTSIAAGTVTGAPGKVHLPNTVPDLPPPSLDQCLASPSASGCASVLDAARNACSADWNAGHCDQVMPSEAVCKATPNALGCAAVIAHQALLACVANPQGPNCGAVLPSFDSCKANGSQLGCDAVLAQRARIDACVANPSAAGCDAILPTWDQCQAQSGVYGCGPAIAQHDRVAACVANPSASCFDTMLPKYETCQASPSTFGCAPVTQRHDAIAACIANPTGASCAAVLPTLAACHADAGVFGCAPVLAQEKFQSCVANPSPASCDAILPALAVCRVTPSLDGCSAVIGKTFQFCLASPNDARCVGILPTLSQCVADKSANGCQAVLPTLQQCTASPSLQGCSVVLPALEQCAANPALEGCVAVLPKPDFCSTHPTDPSCRVFNPTPDSSGKDGSASPVQQAVQTTVTLINSSVSTSTSSSGGGGGTSSSSAPGKDDGSADKVGGPKAESEKSGVKNEKPATKLYCN